jgi:uncharacterized membrane protein YphA (DoxX/SURF4 family)
LNTTPMPAEMPTSATSNGLFPALARRTDLLLRLLVGGMLIPHGVGKFFNMAKETEVFGQVFKLNPPETWVIAIAVFQIAAGALIVSDRLTRWAALAVAAFMLGTIVVANAGNGWFWHMKGIEYSVMWALLALIVAARAER